MIVFLSLPVSLARRILDSVDNLHFEDPTAAVLNAIYTGDYLAEGPDPEAELELFGIVQDLNEGTKEKRQREGTRVVGDKH